MDHQQSTDTTNDDDSVASDRLRGAREIGREIGEPAHRVYKLWSTHRLPGVWKNGRDLEGSTPPRREGGVRIFIWALAVSARCSCTNNRDPARANGHEFPGQRASVEFSSRNICRTCTRQRVTAREVYLSRLSNSSRAPPGPALDSSRSAGPRQPS
jgi:hypothetical protein